MSFAASVLILLVKGVALLLAAFAALCVAYLALPPVRRHIDGRWIIPWMARSRRGVWAQDEAYWQYTSRSSGGSAVVSGGAAEGERLLFGAPHRLSKVGVEGPRRRGAAADLDDQASIATGAAAVAVAQGDLPALNPADAAAFLYFSAAQRSAAGVALSAAHRSHHKRHHRHGGGKHHPNPAAVPSGGRDALEVLRMAGGAAVAWPCNGDEAPPLIPA